MKKKLLAKLMISCGIVFVALGLFASESRAAAMINVPDPTDAATAAFSLIWVSEADSWGERICRAIIDPENIEQFQIDFQFDPDVLQYREIEYITPYTQTLNPDLTPQEPDLTQLDLGLIQDIAGFASPAPSGEVDIFSIIFDPLLPLPLNVEGTVFASSNDFVVAFDPDTDTTRILGPDSIIPITADGSCCVPEPSTILLLGSGLIGLLGVSRKKQK